MKLPSIWTKIKRRTQPKRRPLITQERGKLDPYQSPVTFVVVCGGDFDQTVPNAATTARLGICRGFEQIGIPYLLLNAFDLSRRLSDIPNPICWITGSDYVYLNRANLTTLKKRPHLVWVGAWFENDAEFYRRHDLPNQSWPRPLMRKILSSEPDILFTISPETCFQFYEGWAKGGARLVSLPLACDTVVYQKDTPKPSKFGSVKMAFVGGYWPYKARQFDRYLWPYEDQLSVFGYSTWPYKSYGGSISVEEEASLYGQAIVSPVINEPHVEIMGIDINERVFKVLGCGGLAVTDVTPAYREWFSEEELLVPHNIDEYHEIMRQILNNDDPYKEYRQRGYEAVLQRHTYSHRARAILSYLGVDLQSSCQDSGVNDRA
jgi:hypothetical protein